MRKIFLLIIITSFIIFAQESNQKSVAVTIYNNNFGVIKDVREMDIKKGTNKIEFKDVAKEIDPTSVHIKLDGHVTEQNYQYDLASLDKILQKYIDKEVQLINDKAELIEGQLVSIDENSIVLQKKDEGLIMIPNYKDYRIKVTSLPVGFKTKPALVWNVIANNEGKQDIELSYITNNMKWNCEYVALINEDDTKMGLNAWVSINNNSGASYNNAKLKLIAGDINIIRYNIPIIKYDAIVTEEVLVDEQEILESSFFEYHLYDVEKPINILDKELKQISLFETNGINIKKSYRYDLKKTDNPEILIEFENKKDNNIGFPLPAGKISIYKADGKSNELIGQEQINHIAKNEKVSVVVGKAFDIIGESKIIEDITISKKTSNLTYEAKLRNRKKENISVDVIGIFPKSSVILESNFPYEKESATKYKFVVPVNADKESVLRVKVKYTK